MYENKLSHLVKIEDQVQFTNLEKRKILDGDIKLKAWYNKKIDLHCQSNGQVSQQSDE